MTARGWQGRGGVEREGPLLGRYTISFQDDGNIPELNYGDGYTAG